MVQDILVLGVAEVSKDVLGVAGHLLVEEELVQSQFLHEPLTVLLVTLNLDFVVAVVDDVFVWVFFLQRFGVVGVGQHVSGDRDTILDGVANSQCEGVRIVIKR